MNKCSEFVLDDLLAVTAIPVNDLQPGTAAWQLQPVIPAGSFSPTLTRAVTIGLAPATAGGPLIPITRSTGKAKDDTSDSVAGRLHTVKVTCQADDREATAWRLLRQLELTPSHLLLTFRGGQRAFAQATEDTYLCTVERDGAKTSVSLRVQNIMGIQLIS